MLQTVRSWEDVIAKVKQEYPETDKMSFKFKHLIAAEAANHNLCCHSVAQVALYLGIRLYPRPTGIPLTWPTVLCKRFLAQKYINPLDPCEWVVVMRPDDLGKLPYIIHCTPSGFADARWFYEVAPQLATIIKDPSLGLPFSGRFNTHVNQTFAAQNKNRRMTLGQIQAVNLFFNKYVPALEGICTTCFDVMLPMSGAGERRLHQGQRGEEVEIRLSAAKPMGLPGQTTEYVSHVISDLNEKTIKFALWNAEKCTVQYADTMKQEATHIPWKDYDYNKFSMGMNICQCRNRQQ